MGNFIRGRHIFRQGNRLHFSGQKTQALVEPKFFTFGKQELKTYANAEKGFASLNGTMNRVHQPIACHIGHTIAKCPHTRQHDMTSPINDLSVPCDHGFMPDAFKSFLHATKVSHPVVDDCNHRHSNPSGFSLKTFATGYNTPFVDNTPEIRSSRLTA